MNRLWLLVTLAGLAAATAAEAGEPGAWQPHQLQFYFLGSSTAYTCQGLEAELRALLEQSMARQIIVTPAGPCGGAERVVQARLKFSTLQPAAPRDSRGRIVPGEWHRVTISPRNLLGQGADCELVEQFRSSILPFFSSRNVSANLRCVPFQSSGYPFSLSFDVFAPSDAKLSVPHS